MTQDKINIAEILKDCPKGMELYSPIFGVGVLTKVTNRIHVKFPKEHNVKCFRLDGKVSEDGEIMLYPKGKTTWEGFHRPFKDGDIVTWKDRGSLVAFIYKERKDVAVVKHHFALYTGSLGIVTTGEISLVESEIVFAAEEEKQKLFDAIKANGYKWNDETKTLDKLIRPKFKVGDRIQGKHFTEERTIKICEEDGYWTTADFWISISDQDNWELIHNKFDITTLKPFDKVLMRSSNERIWVATFYSHYYNNKFYGCGMYCNQCIPYEGNQHLLGTTNDCDDFYKTW